MSVGESLGSHSLHSFAEFLQHHINSPKDSSCLTSRRKPLTVLKPFSLNYMAADKSARKGGRQCRGGTSMDLPEDLYELYKTDPEENYGQRKTRIQWIRRYWAEQWFEYRFVTKEYAEKNAIKRPWGDILYNIFNPGPEMKPLNKASIPAWSVDHSLRMLTHRHYYGDVTTLCSSATSSLPRTQRSRTRRLWV